MLATLEVATLHTQQRHNPKSSTYLSKPARLLQHTSMENQVGNESCCGRRAGVVFLCGARPAQANLSAMQASLWTPADFTGWLSKRGETLAERLGLLACSVTLLKGPAPVPCRPWLPRLESQIFHPEGEHFSSYASG